MQAAGRDLDCWIAFGRDARVAVQSAVEHDGGLSLAHRRDVPDGERAAWRAAPRPARRARVAREDKRAIGVRRVLPEEELVCIDVELAEQLRVARVRSRDVVEAHVAD